MSQQLARVSADLTELDRLLAQPVPPQAPIPQSYVPPAVHYAPPPAPIAPPPVAPPPPVATPARRTPRDTNWIGKVLAVAGVAVTLVGRRSAPRPRRASRHPAARDPRWRWCTAGRGTGRRRGPAQRPPRRSGRRNRVGGDRHCRGVHGRHRRHDDLPLGVRTRRPDPRRVDRWRWPHPGPTLGLATARPAGAGAADRARAHRRRWHHDAC